MVIFNRSESFPTGSPEYDSTYFRNWVRIAGWTSDPGIGSGGTAFNDLTPWVAATLYNGWTSVGGMELVEGRSSLRASMTTGASELKPCGFVWNNVSQNEGEVEASFLYEAEDGEELGQSRVNFGVCANVSGGSVLDGGTDSSRLSGGDGYFFGIFGAATGRIKHQLLRVNSGVVTLLREDPPGGLPTGSKDWDYKGLAHVFRMTLEDLGTNQIRIRCYQRVLGSFTPIPPLPNPFQEVLIFEYVDQGPLLTAGRWGFFSGCEVDEEFGSRHQTTTINYCRLRDSANATLMFDDFARYQINWGRQVTGAPGFVGRDVACTWLGDMHGDTTQGLGKIMRRGSESGTIEFNGAAASASGHWTYQYPAASQVNQEYEVRGKLLAGSAQSNVRELGVSLRVSQGINNNPDAAYFAVIRHEDGTGFTDIRVKRRTAGGGTLVLANDTTMPISLGTYYRLRFRILNIEGTDIPQMLVYLDDVQVPLIAVSGLTGISTTAAGVLTDSSNSRITSGPAVAIRVLNGLGSLRNVVVDEWTRGTNNDPIVTPPEDQASIAVAREGAGVTGTLVAPCDWGIRRASRMAIRTHEFERGYKHVSRATSAARRLYVVNAVATTAESAALETFWDDHKGSEIPFYWTPPDDSVAGVFHFAMQRLVRTEVDLGVHRYELLIEELIT